MKVIRVNEFYALMEELKNELDNLLEQEETEEVKVKYNALLKVYNRLRFILENS